MLQKKKASAVRFFLRLSRFWIIIPKAQFEFESKLLLVIMSTIIPDSLENIRLRKEKFL